MVFSHVEHLLYSFIDIIGCSTFHVHTYILTSTAGRFAIVFRYKDINNYDAVGYDVQGNWRYIKYRDGKKTETDIKSGVNVDNQTFTLRIEFSGRDLTVIKDNQQVYAGSVLDETLEGKVGVRTWGYDGNYANITVDELHYIKMTKETNDKGNYSVSFKDENSRGGFKKLTQAGTMEFAEEAMNITGNGHTVVMDQNAPILENGFFETDLTMTSGGRFVIAARMQNENSYAGIGYDNGNWFWNKDGGDGYGNLTAGKKLEANVTYRFRMEYVGNQYTLYVANKKADETAGEFEKILETTIDNLPKTAGKIGFRSWGSGSDKIKIDNVVNGKFNAVLLNPVKKYVLWDDAGTYNIDVKLSQLGNAFSKIMVDGKDLAQEHYSVSTDKSSITIKKEYIASLKAAGTLDTNLSFVFEDGYATNFRLQIQPEPNGDVVKKHTVFDAANKILTKKAGSGDVTFNNEKMQINNGNGLIAIDEDATVANLRNAEVEFLFDPKTDGGNFGIVFRYGGPSDWTMIGPNGGGGNTLDWRVQTSSGINKVIYKDANRIYAKRVKPYKIKIRLVEDVVTLFKDNEEIFSGTVDGLTDTTGAVGLYYNGGAGAAVTYLDIKSAEILPAEKAVIEEKTIASNDLTVKVDNKFPRVIDYTLKSSSATTTGQEKPYYYVEIDNNLYKPTVTSEFTGAKATYHLTIAELNVSFDVTMEVKKNTLDYRITNIKDENNTIHTINFPNQSLVSMSSKKEGAELRVNNYRNDGEKTVKLASAPDNSTHNVTSIAVLSGSDIAAAVNCGSIKSRQELAYQTFNAGDHSTTGIWPNEFLYKGLDDKVIEEPWAVVSITADRNKDNKVDFQDAAIAFRDDCVKDEQSKDRVGAEFAMNSFPMIAMNVGSAAQYPFIRILDNIKKINLGTDGFQQNVVIKGYQAEGHDASHPDFANYNRRSGGLEDFQKLLNESEKYNAGVGVHINHTEVYPEAKQYTALASGAGGWSWYDSAKQIIRENDILDLETGMEARLKDLDKDTLEKLKMIYVDVYFDSRWPAYKLSNAINNMGGEKGVALGTEYVDELTKSSVFAHHIDDRFNDVGNLVRIVNNSEQDIFGSSNLFRGLGDRNTVGIFGWQTSKNYYNTLEAFYTRFLPNKFLAKYPIMQYNSETQAVLGENNEVVTKMEGGTNVITLDGNKVADGNKIFIPWTINGEEKIYHWNSGGGKTTWKLPKGWESVTNVKVFPLSDTGRGEPVTVNVSAGSITLDAKAKTGYVVYKGTTTTKKSDVASMKWGDGSPVKDIGFDSHTFDFGWKKLTADTIAAFENNNLGNTHMILKDKNGGITQELTGLVPGKTYSASVWATVSNAGKGVISVTTPDGKTVSNYIDKSNVKYGIHHTDKYQTYAQRVKVDFVQPEGKTTATIKLEADNMTSGSIVDFDDVRVVAITPTDKGEHFFLEDFESGEEGYGPFTSTESDNSHLSELNQGVTDDTIGGQFSMKVRYGNYLRTMPHTIRFKPNTKYTVSMDYKTWAANAFTFAVKTDEGNSTLASTVADANGKGKVTLEFTTGNYKDYYLDITKHQANDYVVDNLIVDEVSNIDKAMLQKLYEEANKLQASDYTSDSFNAMTDKKNAAKAVIDKADSTEQQRREVYDALNKAIKALVAYAKAEDIAKLTTAIANAKGIKAEDYKKDEAWTALQNKIKEAEILKEKDKVTVPEINEMIKALSTALEAINTVTEKGALKALLKSYANVDNKNYVDGKEIQEFIAAREEAENLVANSSAKQTEVDASVKRLKAAYEGIMPKEKPELQEAVTKAEGYKASNYTASSFAALAPPLAKAKEVLNNAKATNKEVDAALANLKQAISNLVPTTNQGEKNGWVEENGRMRYYRNNVPVSGEWIKEANGGWKFAGKDGYMVIGWLNQDGKWYHLNEKGMMEAGWVQVDNAWYYLDGSGVMATSWLQQGNIWYYLGDNGAMRTGWQQVGETWYYFNGSGVMQTGWLDDKGTWYYLDKSGAMQTGWLVDSGNWYYLNQSGVMQTGWIVAGGAWYALQANGVMKTGWFHDNGTWYFLNSSGAMQTGWYLEAGKWYYLKENGSMATGYITVGGKTYYMDPKNGQLVE